MPYKITKNKDNTYKVIVKDTGKVVANATLIPNKVIQAIEASKRKTKISKVKSKKRK